MAALDLALGVVNVRDTLAEVEVGSLAVVDALDAEKRGGGLLRTLAALVAENDGLGVQSEKKKR